MIIVLIYVGYTNNWFNRKRSQHHFRVIFCSLIFAFTKQVVFFKHAKFAHGIERGGVKMGQKMGKIW